MKIITIQSNIREAISTVEKAVAINPNLPILKNILIKADHDTVYFITTDLRISVTARVSGKIIEEGSITIPIALLSGIIANIKSDRLNLETKENKLDIKTDNYNATINGAAADDYPPIPKIKDPEQYIEVKGIFLKDAIAQTGIAAQESDLRPELGGILFNFSIESLVLAATDGFRLAEKTISAGNFTVKNQKPFKALVPLDACREIMRNTGDADLVKMYYDDNQMLIKTERAEILSRLLEGAFPDYTQIIPKKTATDILVSRDEFANGIRLASILGQKTSEIELRIHPDKKAVEIASADQALGENAYLLPAKIQGDAITAVFNWRYLSEVVKVLNTKEIQIGLQEDAAPAVIRQAGDSSYFYIVKPILRS